MNKRTTYCGLVTEEFLNEKVTLKGWVHNRRDLGGLIFVDLRDREGIVQIVFNPDFSEEALQVAETVRSEYVVEVEGVVTKRDAETINPKSKQVKLRFKFQILRLLTNQKHLHFQLMKKM